MSRCVLIVLDGVGVGALPDADAYGDRGSDTLGNLSRIAGLHLPVLCQLGLGNIAPLVGVPPVATPLALPGRLAPLSVGKDTTVGHWEHMGLVTHESFPTYPHGFPEEILAPFKDAIGRGVLGNKPASGTAIIAELGAEHLTTGNPIVYTSADSVFQIAAHIEAVPLETLYSWCETARNLLRGPHSVARVIARPFKGNPGHFVRTKDRRDFSLEPPGPTYLDILRENGIPVLALGKIAEIFAGRGISTKIAVAANSDNLSLVLDLLRGCPAQRRFDEGLLFTNLVEFDMAWGHRNNVDGFARGLEAVDRALPAILAALRKDDLLVLTADHGVDPTTPSTDHSREYVPLLLYPRPAGAPDKVYEGLFSDTGATLYNHLTGKRPALAGAVIGDLRPHRGWRHFTPVAHLPGTRTEYLPVRLGMEEAEEAAAWLTREIGDPPDVALVLGSGLLPMLPPPVCDEIPYDSIPHWATGSVAGHAHALSIVEWMGMRVALLKGRIHEYEGYDLSEIQMPVRSLALWGARKIILTSSSGALPGSFTPGDVAIAGEVLDLQYPGAGGKPSCLLATDEELLVALGRVGHVHASVNGPQYETPAELAVLSTLGARTVSMSPAGELRAARDMGMRVAVITVVANVGDTTHDAVLAGGASAAGALTATIQAILTAWGGNTFLVKIEPLPPRFDDRRMLQTSLPLY